MYSFLEKCVAGRNFYGVADLIKNRHFFGFSLIEGSDIQITV